MKLRGAWKKSGYNQWRFVAPDGSVHAHIKKDEDVPYKGLVGGRLFLVWTCHTEGNDRFMTLREAKLHGRYRLKLLLEETEVLRP